MIGGDIVDGAAGPAPDGCTSLIRLLDDASQDPSNTHGRTAEERALAREAVA